MKVTLRDIAEATGFSISTVSRALRGEGRISEEHRHQILAKAHEMGYELPTGRRNIPANQLPHVAIITQFETGEFYASFFEGFANAAIHKKVQVSLFSVANDYNQVDTLTNNLRALGYSAAVIFVPELKEKQYRRILHAIPKDFPVISCSNINNPVLDTVTFDAYRGASLIAEHFKLQGYTRLGMIEGPQEKPEARFRTNGFSDMTKNNPDAEIVWTYAGDYTHESGIKAYEDFKKQREQPRAVFAANDAMAFGFMESARADGWRFPEDLAIAGYDNLPLCRFHYPQLTSVNTNYTLLAKNTLDNLLARLGKTVSHQGIVSLVPISLSVRLSSMNSQKQVTPSVQDSRPAAASVPD
ncbi:LacI family DNA-binding transcriptional regulator [Balneolales bacterium ANBcel1]|nr:LacI family DNA-binding transcriptional regulator [Balneolales bacterium ANBcel1]